MARLANSVKRPSDADHQGRRPAGPTGLAGAVGVVHQRSTGQIALSHPGIDEDGTGLERAHEAVEIVEQLSVLVQIAEMGQLRQMGRAERFPGDL